MKIVISIICFLLLLLLCASCISIQSAKYIVLQDSEISGLIRSEVYKQNDQIISVMKEGDSESFFRYFVTGMGGEEELKNSLNTGFPTMVEAVQDINFKVYRDYYCRWQGEGKIHCVVLPEDDYDFSLSIERVGDEMFVSLLDTPEEFHELLLSMVYTKQNDDWKLYICYIGSYLIAGENAVQWYEEALEFYDKDYLVPAIFRLLQANNCLQLAPFLRYEKESEIIDFTKKMQRELNNEYSFPIELSAINSSPVIYSIEPQFVQNEIFPKVKYVTSYSKDHITDVENEAHIMSPLVQELFPGITEGVTHIVFKAFWEPPVDPNKIYQSYGVAVKVNS